MPLVKGMAGRRPELGKIKIGIKGEELTSRKGNKFRPPEKLAHFVVTTTERDARGDFKVDVPLMRELAPEGTEFSKHPALRDVPALTELPIELFSDEIEDVVSQAYCYYPGKTIGARCDGETCTWFVDSRGNKLKTPTERPCDGEHNGDGWKLHTRFDCAIRSGKARFGGLYSFRTTSEITAQQLVGSLATLKMLAHGRLQGLPLVMVVRPMQVTPDGKPTTVYVVHVEARAESQTAILQLVANTEEVRAKFARQIESARTEARKLLAAPGLEPEDEQAEIAEEFHPEVVAAATEQAQPVEPESETPPAQPAGRKSRRTPPHAPARKAAAPAEPESPPPGDEDAPPPEHDEQTGEVPGPKERVLNGVKLGEDEAFLAHGIETAENEQHFRELQPMLVKLKAISDERVYLVIAELYFERRKAVLGKPVPPEFAAKIETARKKGAA